MCVGTRKKNHYFKVIITLESKYTLTKDIHKIFIVKGIIKLIHFYFIVKGIERHSLNIYR